MHAIKHQSSNPLSPNATATPTTMLERAVSSRRFTALHPDDLSAPYPNDDSSSPLFQGDESKSKSPNPTLLASRLVASAFHCCACPIPCLLLGLVLVVVSVLSLVFHSRNIVCVAQFDPSSRVAFFGLEGLESDVGALGVPWCRPKHGTTVEWTDKDLLKGLEEFVPIYDTRPIKNNMYGMGFDHSYGLWFMARSLEPVLMIESGAFKGHSTWVLRQAMPDKPIISLSPRHPEKYLKKGPAYVDGNCTYFAGKDFVDFGSVDWKTVMRKHGVTDLGRVLVFFDDHQNQLKRVKQALKAGFRHLIFEDNYDTGTGDHYSLRQMCDQSYIKGGGHSCYRDSDEARMREKRKKFWEKAVDVDELCGPNEEWWGVRGYMRDNFNHSNERIPYKEHFQNSRFIESILDVYWELPPVAGPSLTHQTRYDPARATRPIVEDGRFGTFKRLGLNRYENSLFNGYTQMVYIQISEQGS